MSTRASVLGVPAVVVLLLLSLIPAEVSAAPPDDWAWAVVRDPADPGYTITGKDRGNSAGGVVEYTRDGIGQSHVRFGGLTGAGGTVHVTPLTSKPHICSTVDWGTAAGSVDIKIACFDRLGFRKDVPYVVSFVLIHQLTGVFAYAWANEESSASYDPDPTYQGNSRGGTNHALRTGTGTYRVDMTDLGRSGGNVQVSAFGDEHWPCRTDGWTDSGNDEAVGVICRDEDGHLVDSKFTVSFMRNEGLKADAGRKWAYLLANRPTDPSYTPAQAFRKADPPGRPKITRIAKGEYSVKLPSMPLGGAAQVTAYGEGSTRCNVESIRKSGAPQRIGVRCFNARGTAPADSKFSLSFVR